MRNYFTSVARVYVAFATVLLSTPIISFSQGNTACGGTTPFLPVNAGCSWTAGTTVGSTQQTNGWNAGTPSCGAMGPDVWYKIIAPASGSITINTQAGTTTDGVMALYSDIAPCDNAGWSELACDDDSGPGLMPTITYGGLAPGDTYYIRFWDYGGGTGTFDICVIENAPPPPCAGDIVVNSTTYSQSGLTTCGFGDDYSSADACGSSYMNGDDIVIEYTPTTTECVDFNLSNTGTWVGMFITDGCPNDAGVSCLASATASGGNPSITGFNVSAGVTYYITVSTWPSPQCTAFDLDIIACPPPPPNDECTGAINLPVNPDNLCGMTTAGTIQNATSSYQVNSCGGASDDDDVWFTFTATNTTHTIDLLNITGSTTDLYHSVWDTDCNGFGTNNAILCSDPNSSVLTGLTIGNTYIVRVYSWSTATQTSSFDICIGTPPPPPPNDDCAGAINVPVSTGACNYVTSSIASATPSPEATGCGGTADDDVWFEFTATSTDVQIDLTNIFGGTTDLYHSVYAGNCGSIGAPLVCSDPNTSQVNGLTIGNTYYVRVYSWTSTAGQTSVFDICISEIGPCGVTSTTEDFCPYPATLTQGPGSWASSTYPYYSADTPANSGTLFCGSVENNSWYEFTAQNATETFNFIVSNCVNGSGIQAQVYEVTTDAQGCCTNFTSVSNCWNPGTMTNGTVTATGLTIGNNYILMVDGYAGDNCDFSVIDWTAQGIQLPVGLVDFKGVSLPRKNVLNWTTEFEENSDYFTVKRSFDGIGYEAIGNVQAHGNSQQEIYYDFIDEDVRAGIVYYQLDQVDVNGASKPSEVIALNRTVETEGLIAVYPNPTNSTVYVELKPMNSEENEVVELLDTRGVVQARIEIANNDFVTVSFDLSKYANGMYIIRHIDAAGASHTSVINKN